MSIKFLKKNNINFLHYFCHINNLDSIIKNGIFSYNSVATVRSNYIDISDPKIQKRRNRLIFLTGKSVHDYVPLYFATQTPMQYVITTSAPTKGRFAKAKNDDLVFLDFELTDIFDLEGVIFTDGNASSGYTKFYDKKSDLKNIDCEIINCSNDYYSTNGECYKEEWKRKKAAEVLVPEFLASKFIKRIVVFDTIKRIKLSRKYKNISFLEEDNDCEKYYI